MTANVGPYESEADMRGAPLLAEVRALHDTGRVRSGDPDRLVLGTRMRYLIDTCRECGVEVGAFDVRVLVWLAGWEDHAVQVVLGLIRRAHNAGWQAAAGEDGG